jgi:outer membrane lipoprotein SlyB
MKIQLASMLLLLSSCLTACNQQTVPDASAASVPAAAARAAPAAPAQPAVCNICGTVRSITEIKQDGRGTGAGAVIGGIVGGVAGNQVGGGSGRKIATAAGVVGGAILGNEVEQNRNGTSTYEILVDMQNGSQQLVRTGNVAGISTGSAVNVQGGNITLR